MKIAVVTALLVLSSSALGAAKRPCWAVDPEDESTWYQPITSQYAILRTLVEGADLDRPETDAKLKMSYGDYRLQAVAGFTTEYPPLNKLEDDDILCTLGMRFPKGMSDAIESDQHAELMKRWRKYAEEYNSVVLRAYRNGEIPLNKRLWCQ